MTRSASARRGRHRPLDGRFASRFDGRAIDGLSPAIRSPRRCSPTASISSAARSSITGRAASCRPGAEEPNALVELDARRGRSDAEPARDQVELYDGLDRAQPEPLAVARASMSAPSTTCSRRCSRPASTTRPSCGRRLRGTSVYEPRHPRAPPALASRPASPIPTATQHRYAHCDVLVVGAGPAGLAAALAAAEAGARVILCDEQAELGGSLLAEPRRRRSTARPARTGLEADGRQARGDARTSRVLPRTTAFGYYAQNFRRRWSSGVTDHLPIAGRDSPRERLWQVRAKQVVLATGAIERPLVFAGQRPARHHAGRPRAPISTATASRSGARIVVRLHGNDRAYAAALDLQKAGVDVAAIVDLRAIRTGARRRRAADRAASRSCRPRRDPARAAGCAYRSSMTRCDRHRLAAASGRPC